MPCRDHRPVLAGGSENRLVALERVDDPVGQRDRRSVAGLPEHDGDPLFEVDVLAPKAVAVFVTWGRTQCGAASASECEYRHDGPVPDRSRPVVVGSVECGVRPLVDELACVRTGCHGPHSASDRSRSATRL